MGAMWPLNHKCNTWPFFICLSSSTSTMLIDSDEIPALQSFKASISRVAVDGTSEPITEDVACVGTLSELLDKVRGNKTKKKACLCRFGFGRNS
ncbi:hypothetical protein HanXRQr2_Chr14g0635901 [Helianthus annuus]|uniref:Uncharacterized protein n=1 Tax=Helianthus annuus TaxID=4232 RepID=A0A9K3E7V1_HELAN|nr:hypothetical protein HanXRQr2_Chr14g0635901 [Helianthus annuus]KAJ0839694.1 hypothetical protein HanPSC8_Chr14g0609881 [Helianthus annuus]